VLVALDQNAVRTPNTPEWWMTQLATKALQRNRIWRLALLEAYRAGRPPLLNVSPAQRQIYYDFLRIAKSNFARVIVRAPAERMGVRAIRTAAANDDNGDQVAWRHWTGAGLDVTETDTYSDMLTFAEGYERVAVRADGSPTALPCVPWQTFVVPDPLDPYRAKAAFYIAWDEWAQQTYAYLWLPGQQWVASTPATAPPPRVTVPGTSIPGRWQYDGVRRFSFSPSTFTMRPNIDDVAEADRDGGPYSETFEVQEVPVQRFPNRDGVGEFEEHLDLLDRINHTIMTRVVTAAVQAYRQRALQQNLGPNGEAIDRLPDKNPDNGETINWAEIFMPGPDGLWRLPPGVSIWESGEVQLQPIISAGQEDIKQLSSVTSIPFNLFSPDGINQSAEGAQLTREGLVFKVEDRDKIAGRCRSRVASLMFKFGPDSDRYDDAKNDRADASQIIVDWKPAERFSLAEKAQADSLNKSLSRDMAAQKIWGLTADEVAINRAQLASEALLGGGPSTVDSAINGAVRTAIGQSRSSLTPPTPEPSNNGAGQP
jgi:hypothetical protein